MTAFAIYLMMQADPIVALLHFCGVASVILAIAVTGFYTLAKEKNPFSTESPVKKWIFKMITTAIISSFLGVTLPTSKTIAAIVGVHTITNIEGVEKLPANTIKMLNSILEGYTKEEKGE